MDRSALLVAVIGVMVTASGCIQGTDDGDGSDGPTYRSLPQYGMEIRQVELHGEIAPGEAKTWRLRAVNTAPQGGNMFEYRHGCGEPWDVTLAGPDGAEVQWTEPMVQCQGFQEREFSGGDTLDFEWTWDGRVWDGDYADAAPGTYALAVFFEARHGGEHDSRAGAETTFRVV